MTTCKPGLASKIFETKLFISSILKDLSLVDSVSKNIAPSFLMEIMRGSLFLTGRASEDASGRFI